MDNKKYIQGQGFLSTQSASGMESFTISLGKKCERLSTALYLITNFLSDSEPLKSRLRLLSLELVRDASYVRYGTISVETNVLDNLRANIGETLALLELAFIAGLVSEMNFSILKREYVSLRSAIEVKKATRESRSDTILGDTFFGSPLVERPVERAPRPASSFVTTEASTKISQGHSIGQSETKMSESMSETNVIPRASIATKKTHQGHAKTSGADNLPTALGLPLKGRSEGSAPKPVAQEARRSRILKLIKDNREVTIKDITSYFPDLSEKTIQRELVALTESGVLKKMGERRWSRYALA